MANTEAKINFVDLDGPFLDVANFFEVAAQPDTLDSMEKYKEPNEDLLVFFEKAMYWACTKTLKGPAGTFWLFTQLPGEIRIKIWEACISPSQIHLTTEHVYEGEADDSIQFILDRIGRREPPFATSEDMEMCEAIFGDKATVKLYNQDFLNSWRARTHHNRHCRPAFPTTFYQKLTFIARINREARDVALTYVNRHIKLYQNLALIHVNVLEDDIDRIDESSV